MRRRLFDSILPFGVLVGLTVFAVGMVRVVEIGAASQSKTRSVTPVATPRLAPQPTFDFEHAQAEYEEMMRQHASGRNRSPKGQNQVAYQLSLMVDAERDRSRVDVLPKSAAANDMMDWALFEQGSEDPRSALQRGSTSSTYTTRTPR